MAYEAVLNRVDVYRVLLEDRAEGVYINVFSSPGSKEPDYDWLAPHLDGAKGKGREEFGIEERDWKVVPNEPWHAPADEMT